MYVVNFCHNNLFDALLFQQSIAAETLRVLVVLQNDFMKNPNHRQQTRGTFNFRYYVYKTLYNSISNVWRFKITFKQAYHWFVKVVCKWFATNFSLGEKRGKCHLYVPDKAKTCQIFCVIFVGNAPEYHFLEFGKKVLSSDQARAKIFEKPVLQAFWMKAFWI